MGLHIELNSWAQAEEHFRDVDQDQGQEHYDRDMFNCELALNMMGIGTLFSCRGHLDGLAAFPYITIIPQRAVAGLVPRYVSMMETQLLSQEALALSSCDPSKRFRELYLVNQGVIVGLLSDQETLRAYQDEFMAFAEYLKSIWGR